MVILNGDKKDYMKADFQNALAQIHDLKKNINISYEDISSLIKTTDEMTETFRNNEEFKKVSNEIKDFYNTWIIYHKNSEKKAEELILSGGGYDENKEIKCPENVESVNTFIKENQLDSIKRHIDELYNKISNYSFTRNDKVVQGIQELLKNFDKEIFNDKPLVEFLYSLYSKEYYISSYVRMIIDRLLKSVNMSSPEFNNFELIVIPKKETVIAGKNYEATVYLNAKEYTKIDGEEPVVKVNGVPVETKNYIANIVYPTSREVEFDKNGKHVITLKIEYFQKNPFSNKDIELKKNVKFTVVKKDIIEGTIQTSNILLKQCSNNFTIRNEDPELNNNVTYDVKGGRIISIDNIDRYTTNLTIYPTGDECEIIVKNDNQEIKRFKNKTTEPEMPFFDFLINDNQVVNQMELNSNDISDISIDVINNSDFETRYPLDSVNVVKDWTIELKDNNKKTFNTISVTGTDRYTFKTDDKLLLNSGKCKYVYIRVNNVVRQHRDSKNSNNVEEIPLIKPFEILARQINVSHAKKRQNNRRNRRN